MKNKQEKLELEPYYECLLLDITQVKEYEKYTKTQKGGKKTWMDVFNSKYYTQKPK